MGGEPDGKTPDADPQRTPSRTTTPPGATTATPTTPGAGVLGLQSTAGNAAVTRLVGDPDAAASDLTVWLAMPNPSAHREQIFRDILDVGPARTSLPGKFQEHAGRDLEATLQAELSEKDWWRARAYLQHGRLRAADTIALATGGIGTDEDTLNRVLAVARTEFAATEADLAADYSSLASAAAPLFQVAATSRIAGLLAAELSGKELDKARAILAFGTPRPIDDVRIATNQVGTDEDALFKALQKGDKAAMPADWVRDYAPLADQPATLDGVLADELSGSDLTKARKILAGQWDARAQIFAAVDGIGTDEDAIWDALGTMTDAEKAAFQTEWRAKAGVWTMLDDDLSASDMQRAEALVFGGSDAVSLIRKLGGENGSDVVDAVKKLDAAGLATAKAEYTAVPSTFAAWLGTRVPDATALQHIATMLTGTPAQQLRLAVEGWGTDEDYLFHVLGLLSEPQKAEVAGDKSLMDALEGDLSTSDMNRARDMLRKSGMTGVEAAADVDARVARERSWVSELFSPTSDALDDEQRAMRSLMARAMADGQVDAAEDRVIAAQAGVTEEALAVYTKVRDELEAIAANVLTTAAAIIVSVVTAGAGSGAGAAMIASQLAAQAARAALVSALVKVAVTKVAKGDRFDVLGADGAMTFATGAADGVLSVFGGPMTQTLINPAFRNAASLEARAAALAAWEGAVGRRLVATTVEGGIGSGIGTVIETGANEDTWKGGLEKGFTKLAGDTGTSILTGAGTSLAQGAAKEAGSAVWAKIKGGDADGAGHTGDGGVTDNEAGTPAGGQHADGAGGAGGQGARTPAATPTEPTVVMRLASPEQVAGLPPDLRGVVPVVVDPGLTGGTVRVHYDVAPDGLVAGIHLRIAPGADALTIGLHAGTVRAMQKWTGFAGKVRMLAARVQECFVLQGMPRPGTAAFEARLEVDKLTGIIDDRMRRFMASTDVEVDKALLAELDTLEAQLAHHQHALDDLDPLASSRPATPTSTTPQDGDAAGAGAGTAPLPRGYVAVDAADQPLVDACRKRTGGAGDRLAKALDDPKISPAAKARMRTEVAEAVKALDNGELTAEGLGAVLGGLGRATDDHGITQALAELANARRAATLARPGTAVQVQLTAERARQLGIDLGDVPEADTFFVDVHGVDHVHEVKGTSKALTEKIIAKPQQLQRLADLQRRRAAAVEVSIQVDTDVRWTDLCSPVKSGTSALDAVIASGLPLRLGDRNFVTKDLVALREAILADVARTGVGNAGAVAAGKATMTWAQYFDLVPTLDDLEQRLSRRFP